MEDLNSNAQRLAERCCAAGNNHELLKIDAIVGVGATVEDVHHRHRQNAGVGSTEVAPERLTGVGGAGVGAGE